MILLTAFLFFSSSFSMKKDLFFIENPSKLHYQNIMKANPNALKCFLETNEGKNFLTQCKDKKILTVMSFIKEKSACLNIPVQNIIDCAAILYKNDIPFVNKKTAANNQGSCFTNSQGSYFYILLTRTLLFDFCAQHLSKDDLLFFLNAKPFMEEHSTYFLHAITIKSLFKSAKQLYIKHKKQLLLSTESSLQEPIFHHLMRFYFGLQTSGLKTMMNPDLIHEYADYHYVYETYTKTLCKTLRFFMIHLDEDVNKKNNLNQTPREYYSYLIDIFYKYNTNPESLTDPEEAVWNDCLNLPLLEPHALLAAENHYHPAIIALWHSFPSFEQLWDDISLQECLTRKPSKPVLYLLRDREYTGKKIRM